MADVNYVDPTSLNTIAGQNNPGGQFPNIGPLQGMMQGQAFQRTNEFLDLSKQNELMNQQKKQQELSEFMANTPYRQQATKAKSLQEASESNLADQTAAYKLGRLPDEDRLNSLKQRTDIINAQAAMGSSERQMYTSVAPRILSTLDDKGQATPETEKVWQEFKTLHDPMFPNNKLENDPLYGHPTTEALTAMKVMHDLTVNDPKYQQEMGLTSMKTGSAERIAGADIASKEKIATAHNEMEMRIKEMEIAGHLNATKAQHVREQLMGQAYQAKAHFYSAGQDKTKLSPEDQALLDPELFNRIFAQYGVGMDQVQQYSSKKAQGGIEGTLNAIQPKDNTNYNAANEALTGKRYNTIHGAEVGDTIQTNEGEFKYKGGDKLKQESWEKVK